MRLRWTRASLAGSALLASSWLGFAPNSLAFGQGMADERKLSAYEHVEYVTDAPPESVPAGPSIDGYGRPNVPPDSTGQSAGSNGMAGQSAGSAGTGMGSSSGAGQARPASDRLDYSRLGRTQVGLTQNSIAVAGAGLAAAAGGIVNQPAASPLLSPGFLTAATAQSPFTLNRVFFNYALYDQFQFATAAVGPAGSMTRQSAFNLNQFNVGFEKTLLDGMVSVYVQAPFLYASNNVTTQTINGPGDLSAGFKVMIAGSQQTGNALSAGLTVAAPTAHPGQFAMSLTTNGHGTVIPNGPTTSVNPTFLQPWIAGQLSWNKWFVQEYIGVLVPLPNQIVPSINNNLALGYRMFNCGCPDHWISSLTPMLNAQVFVPLATTANPGTTGTGPTLPISFPTQLFLTEGCQLGIGQRVSIFGGVVEPVVGPRAFNIGATFGANLYF
jgi:hypothetical protein